MTAVAEKNDKARFLAHAEQLARKAPAQFATLRDSARAALERLDFPGRRTEDWRFTSLAPLLNTPFDLAEPAEVEAGLLPPLPTPDALRLVLVNGVVDRALSRLAAGVWFGPLAEAKASGLGMIADHGEQIFTALNTAHLRDGAFLRVDGVVEAPIEIIHVSVPGRRPTVSHPRALLVFGSAARARVVERFLGAGEGTYFTNALTEITVAEGAEVEHCTLQQQGAEAFHVAGTHVRVAGRSKFTTQYVSVGGRLVRNEIHVRFEGEYAEATVNGLYLGAGRQHVDNFTVIDHAVPNCNSHELYKGVLADHAHGVFNGKIFVRPDAQKTDAKQTNQVLLLSDDATINTKPQLEILADDVKCTHGATVGQLDDAQQFYLQSRGLSRDEARSLLTFAFANDVVRRLPVEAIRDELERLIVSRKFV